MFFRTQLELWVIVFECSALGNPCQFCCCSVPKWRGDLDINPKYGSPRSSTAGKDLRWALCLSFIDSVRTLEEMTRFQRKTQQRAQAKRSAGWVSCWINLSPTVLYLCGRGNKLVQAATPNKMWHSCSRSLCLMISCVNNMHDPLTMRIEGSELRSPTCPQFLSYVLNFCFLLHIILVGVFLSQMKRSTNFKVFGFRMS